MKNTPIREAQDEFPQLAEVSGDVLFTELTGSTQDDLAELWTRADSGVGHASVLIADHQSAGRGRVGRHWFSLPGGSLLISVVIEIPARLREQVGWVTLAAAAAARQALADFDIPALISWPNDIVLHPGKPLKMAGIIGEIAGEREGVLGTVVGMGMNLRIPAHQLPTPVSTSLAAEGLPVPERDALAAGYVSGLLSRMEGLVSAGNAQESGLVGEINRYCETLRAGVVVNRPHSTPVNGTGVRVTANGGLTLQTADGTVTVTAGEVSMIDSI